jgi:hypothetical protein
MRRAARYDGFFPVNLESPDQLAEIVARLAALREKAGRSTDQPYEVIAELEPGTDPAPYQEAGATWGLTAPEWEGISVDGVRGVIREGPASAQEQTWPSERSKRTVPTSPPRRLNPPGSASRPRQA